MDREKSDNAKIFEEMNTEGEIETIEIKPFISWHDLNPGLKSIVDQEKPQYIPGRESQEFSYDTVYINRINSIGRARVEDDKALETSLGEDLYNAHIEIGQAINLDIDYRTYPHEASFIEKIPVTGSAEEKREWVIERLRLFSKWRQQLPFSLHYGICFDICYRGITIKSCAWERIKDKRTISKKLREALGQWISLRDGEPAEVRERPKPRPKGEFVARKVVIIEYE